jgi:hypothetical protein
MVEQKALIDAAFQEILDILDNQHQVDIEMLQRNILRVQEEFARKMAFITAIQWIAFALAIGAAIYVWSKVRHGRNH